MRTRALATLSVIFLGLAASAPTLAAPVEAKVDRAHSTIGFTGYTKLFDADGHFKKWAVAGKVDPDAFENSRVNVSIDTESIDTDNGMRDNHLRQKEFLWCETHPKSTFTTSSIEKTGDDKYVIVGTFSLRGVSKKIRIPVTVLKEQDEKGRKMLRVKGGIRISRAEYGLEYSGGMLLPTVKDEVDIKLDVNFITG